MFLRQIYQHFYEYVLLICQFFSFSDEEKCENNLDACINGGICQDDIKNYSCNCTDGFTGDHCEIPPDYCTQNSCGVNLCFNSLDDKNGACACDEKFFEPGIAAVFKNMLYFF